MTDPDIDRTEWMKGDKAEIDAANNTLSAIAELLNLLVKKSDGLPGAVAGQTLKELGTGAATLRYTLEFNAIDGVRSFSFDAMKPGQQTVRFIEVYPSGDIH